MCRRIWAKTACDKHIIQGINSWAKHKQAQRLKGPIWQLHMRERERDAAHKQGDTSSIRGNTFSTNQTRSRGSTSLPELPNHLKTSPCTCISHGGPPSSHLTENWAKQAQPTVVRPTRSPDQVVTAHRPHRLSDDTWQGVVGPQWWFGSFLGQEAGGSLL